MPGLYTEDRSWLNIMFVFMSNSVLHFFVEQLSHGKLYKNLIDCEFVYFYNLHTSLKISFFCVRKNQNIAEKHYPLKAHSFSILFQGKAIYWFFLQWKYFLKGNRLPFTIRFACTPSYIYAVYSNALAFLSAPFACLNWCWHWLCQYGKKCSEKIGFYLKKFGLHQKKAYHDLNFFCQTPRSSKDTI